MNKTLTLLITSVALSLSANAFVDVHGFEGTNALGFSTLSGTVETETFTDLTVTNHGTSYGSHPFGGPPGTVSPWPNPVAADSGDATLYKSSGAGYFASSSLYNPSSTSVSIYSVSDTTSLDIDTVVFQLDAGGAVSSATLTYTGGSQTVNSSSSVGSYGSFNPQTQTTTNTIVSAFQFDLSGLSGITDYSVTWAGTPHSTVYAIESVAGDTFSVVPEPNAFALLSGLIAVVVVTLRRR